MGPEALSPADLVELGLNYQLGENDLARDFGLALSLFNTGTAIVSSVETIVVLPAWI